MRSKSPQFLPRKRAFGFTQIELMISILLLGLLSLMTVALFNMGAGGWKKMDAQSSLLADHEVLSRKLDREVQRSIDDSASVVSVNGLEVFSLLSAMDDSGTFALNESGDEVVWQRYLIFFFQKEKGHVYFRDLPLEADAPEAKAPVPLKEYLDRVGTPPDLLKSGRLLMENVKECDFKLAGSMLTLEIRASRKRYGAEAEEELHMIQSIAFRN